MAVQKNIPKIIIYFIIQTKGDNGVVYLQIKIIAEFLLLK